METEYLPEFGGVYLEDSYLMGVVAEGRDLRLKLLFALTTDHPAYTPPERGEAHCFREGSILIEQPSIVEWLPGTQSISRDLDGTLDFGSIQLFRCAPDQYRFITEWFDMTVKTPQLHLKLEP